MRTRTKTLSARIAWWTPAFLLLVLLAVPAHAQFGSSLSGTVLDASKAVIPHATVTLINSATQQTLTSTTSDTGAYHFSELAPGSYSLTVAAVGFKTTKLTDLAISAETPRNVDVTLQAGGASESIQVNGDYVPLLQTADASISTTLGSEEIQRLPTFGADAYELLRTAPGITGDGARNGTGGAIYLPNAAGPGGSNAGIFQTENEVQISAAGQRQADNTFNVDGVSVNSLTHGGSAVVSPSMEAIGQMTIVSTSLDASDGRNSGAQIKIVTKSGTNSLHGSLFGLYDETGLNSANKWGGPNNALPETVINDQRSYAASLGGPVVRNKLFYFVSFAGFTTASNNQVSSYVETPDYRKAVIANRAGGVSAAIFGDPGVLPRIRAILTPKCDGLTLGVNCNVVTSAAGTPALDIGSLTPGGVTQIGVFPANNQIGGGLVGNADIENAQLYVPAHSRGKQFNARGDWQITPKDLLAGSVYFTKLDNYGTSGAAGSRPQADLPFKPLNSAATIIYIHTFSPAWLNEFRINSTRFADNGIRDSAGVTNFGIPYVNVQTLPWAIQFGATASSTTPSVFAENTHEARDMVTHNWHSHAVRAGGELRMEQDNDNLSGSQRPTYAMQGLWTMANDAAIYEQITANPLTGGAPLAQRYFRSEDMAAYVQDDWKVSPNLTVNLGLRWEYFTPLRNKGYEINYPVLGTTAGQELAGMTLQLHNHLWKKQPYDFAPKVGFAWTPNYFNQKLVVRGGFAIAYNHLDIALFNNALEDGPNIASFGLCCASNSGSAGVKYEMGTSTSPASFPVNPALGLGINPLTGFPCEFGSTAGNCINNNESYEVYGALPNTKQPVSDLYSLDMQYQLPYNFVGEAGYTGSIGRHFARLVNQNFTHSQVNSPVYAAYFAQTDSNQSYNALNVNLTRHVAQGLFFSAYYTWSKSLDNVSNGDAADSLANQTNPADNRSEWGPSDYDAHQRITVTGVYETPHVHSSNKVVKAAADGWTVTGIVTHHTAFPWTPVTWNLQTSPLVPGANVVGPTRPLQYFGGAGTSCSNNAFEAVPYAAGSASNFSKPLNPDGSNPYFVINTPVNETNYTYKPGIRRNSFRGPCYSNIDMSFAKQFTIDALQHHTQLRLQLNAFNIFNALQLAPIVNGNNNGPAIITNSTFGMSPNGNAGRVLELTARIQF